MGFIRRPTGARPCRSFGFPWVAELPRVVRQGNGTVNDGLQIGLDLKALLAELFEAVGFPKGPSMPREERLECLLGGLLGVEHDVLDEWWLCRELVCRCG